MFTLTLLACMTEVPTPDGAELPPSDLPESAHESCENDSRVIIETPSQYGDLSDMGFTRYTELLAPGGQPIRIFAQDELSEAQILRARNLLRFFLTDVPGSDYGSDKSAVADSMAENEAILVLPNGAHEEGNEPRVNGQPLYSDELPVEGSAWYLNNNLDHRDAAFEEIFHLLHDTGIGTDQPGALPDYQTALLAEAEAAVSDGRWGIAADPGVEDWIDELRQENSLAQEYIAAVIDSYYGMWSAWEGDGGMWGIYIARDRDEIYALDEDGAALLEGFLPTASSFEANLDPGFTGTFSLVFDESEAYTHRSQYLTAVTLTGEVDASIAGNHLDNTLRGNTGDNTLDGGEGEDTVVYCTDRADYTITVEGETVIISGEGTDTLYRVEVVHFRDGAVSVSALTSD